MTSDFNWLKNIIKHFRPSKKKKLCAYVYMIDLNKKTFENNGIEL